MKRAILFTMGMLLIIFLSFGGGYLFGNIFEKNDSSNENTSTDDIEKVWGLVFYLTDNIKLDYSGIVPIFYDEGGSFNASNFHSYDGDISLVDIDKIREHYKDDTISSEEIEVNGKEMIVIDVVCEGNDFEYIYFNYSDEEMIYCLVNIVDEEKFESTKEELYDFVSKIEINVEENEHIVFNRKALPMAFIDYSLQNE